MDSKKNPEIKCPTCGRKGDWLTKPEGPFCSTRCKWVDLGKWFAEEHVVSEPLRTDFFDEYSRLPPGSYLDQPEKE